MPFKIYFRNHHDDGAVPCRFIASGPFAMRLSNMIDQLLKRLGTDIVILDELPTMNRYST